MILGHSQRFSVAIISKNITSTNQIVQQQQSKKPSNLRISANALLIKQSKHFHYILLFQLTDTICLLPVGNKLLPAIDDLSLLLHIGFLHRHHQVIAVSFTLLLSQRNFVDYSWRKLIELTHHFLNIDHKSPCECSWKMFSDDHSKNSCVVRYEALYMPALDIGIHVDIICFFYIVWLNAQILHFTIIQMYCVFSLVSGHHSFFSIFLVTLLYMKVTSCKWPNTFFNL